MANSTLARNDLSRAFIFKDGMDVCCPTPHYFPCLGMDSLSQDFGDITRVECPDPYNYGSFIEVAQLPGEIGRLTTTLSTRLSRTELSIFRNMAVRGCGFDLHLHFGVCQKPTDFNAFDKMMVFEDVYVTSYGTDPLVALQSSDRDTIMETIDITVGDYYEIVPLHYVPREKLLTDTLMPIIDSTYADVMTCGAMCNAPSDGCSDLFAITSDGMIVWSQDSGKTWTLGANDWDVADANVGIGYLNGFLFSFTNDADLSVTFATKKEALADVVPTTVPTILGNPDGIVLTDLGVGQSKFILVGEAGYIGLGDNPTRGLDESYLGVYSTETFNKVQFRTGTDTALAVGANGAIVFYNGSEFIAVDTTTSILAGLNLTAAYPYSDRKWLVADDTGKLFCNDDCLESDDWTEVRTPNTGIGNQIDDIVFVTRHVGYMVAQTDIYVTYDGSCTWVDVEKCASKANHNPDAIVLDILPCTYNVNDVVFVGNLAGAGYLLDGHVTH